MKLGNKQNFSFKFNNGIYNSRRRHSNIGSISLVMYESLVS